MKILGVDIGGTEIKAAAVCDGKIGQIASVKTEAARGRDAICHNLKTVIQKVRENNDFSAIGIGSAGTIDCESGRVLYATDNLPGWTGFNLAEFIEGEYQLPVFCDNDANAALAGEMAYGSGIGYRDVVMLTLGTGVGGSNAVGGELMRGAGYAAGRWGHTILYPDGRICNCGQRGCAERYVSGTAFQRGAERIFGKLKHGSEFFAFLNVGNNRAECYMDNFTKQLACLVTTVTNALNPELIIIGGGLVTSADLWWERYFIDKVKRLPVRLAPAALKNTAGMLGAAHLAERKFFAGKENS